MTDLRHLAARYRLGLVDSETLANVAKALLEEGRQTPAVIDLLILECPLMAEAGPLFEKVCEQASIPIPREDEAANELLRHHLNAMASGSFPACKGLEIFMQEFYWPYFSDEASEKYVGDAHDMQHLVGAYWSYDALMERPHEVSWDGKYGAEAISRWEESVRQYARNWLEKHAPTS